MESLDCLDPIRACEADGFPMARTRKASPISSPIFLGITMAIDGYLQIDGIKGESTDDKHKDWIEVTGVHWGVYQPKSATLPPAATLPKARNYSRSRFQSWRTFPHRSLPNGQNRPESQAGIFPC